MCGGLAVFVVSSGGGPGDLPAGMGVFGTRIGGCGQGLGVVATIEAMGFTAFCPSYVLLELEAAIDVVTKILVATLAHSANSNLGKDVLLRRLY